MKQKFFIVIFVISIFVLYVCKTESGSDSSTTPSEKIKVDAPVFSPVSGTEFSGSLSITLTCNTDGAEIRYTMDGITIPSESVGIVYTGAFIITSNTEVKAVAYKTGLTTSNISVSHFTKSGTTANPIITPSDGSSFAGSQSVSITTTTPGASIRYTTNGSIPSETDGTIYAGRFTIYTTTTVKAVAYKSGLENSAITNSVITEIIGSPVFSPTAGTFSICPFISITSPTSGAVIKFTRDGTDPKTSPTAVVYSSPFYFNGILKAYVYRGTEESSVVTGEFLVTGIARIPKTGQITSYRAGDDGTFRKGVNVPEPRFTNNGNGTITDNLTGLMWEQTPSASTFTWEAAFSTRIAALNTAGVGGHTDWRLPNKKEILSLLNFGQSNNAAWLNSQGYIGIKESNYWTSTTAAYSTASAWALSMNYFMLNTYLKTGGRYVIAVRGGD